ncbi:ATP-dependent dethiobiotin synthetase BioD [Nostoc sp. PCC 7120 = FACHB-418]|uniref:ATP-dependent dethiobiotin synthetase BioD n=2 Tax=Nostocaceae TaxID=1162 RepID=A0A1Z4KMQ1_ANAVA|nr:MULTISPECIES: dethiobiotin synthase [Nostocaceae]BAY70280.1 dithiobiotin synthetase [Trichormus variabilis NIES-23]HBW30669.1 ATP-dependent dethiobiotin synthetase BioD [Nostoc sp. UBA8866]MBD2173447.1 ATP-dependent dethiobiotin synthetase BioD [Anabaena cylindrica FACHB-318]MBD2265244.1 ATP-dependent dethiobiotin synthetase BioD [Anabaena sp. FACHB-709]MBD2274508.1 ATP-dependent dethiobiotin synthetase BioD [Nostoc sp. PCC 7120 = FACHB-418]
MKSLLITGTDTEAGKTALTTVLAAYCQKYYPQGSWGIMKPIQSGIGDREWYQNLFTLEQTIAEITPLHFSAPLAPPIAAAKENRSVDLAIVWQTLTQLRSRLDVLLIEALGGLGSPVTDELTVADLAGEWRLPTVLVVPVKLGSLGQVVANVALARQARVDLKGIVLNCTQPLSDEEIADLTPKDLIQSLTNIPVLGCLPYIDNFSDFDKLVQIASNLDLETLK